MSSHRKPLLRFKKRYIAYGILALELISLPAAAKIIGHALSSNVTPPDQPYIVAQLIDEIPGRKRFAVASDNNFHIIASDIKGSMKVDVYKSGTINHTKFGQNAQLPGPKNTCSLVTQDKETIYQSFKTTAASDGDVVSRAVIIVVNYSKTTSPKISFESGFSKAPIAQIKDCSGYIA